MSVADQVDALKPPMPLQFMGSLASGGVQQTQNAVQRAGSPGTPTLDIKTEARKDPVAAQKVIDVDTDPDCAPLKAAFFAGAETRLNKDSSAATNGGKAALKAMRAEVEAKQGTYLLQGRELPAAQLVAANGITRILDLPSLYNYGYLKPSIKGMYANADAFVSAAQARRFDPKKDLDNRRSLRGKVKETWWAATGNTAGMNLSQMISAFHLDGDPSYPKGAVRLTVLPADVAAFNLKVHKPTALDGMQQGWGTDPWWVKSNDPHWGLTKKNAKEVVMGAAKLSCFSKRDLVVP